MHSYRVQSIEQMRNQNHMNNGIMTIVPLVCVNVHTVHVTSTVHTGTHLY